MLARFSKPAKWNVNTRRNYLKAVLLDGCLTEWVDLEYDGSKDPEQLGNWLLTVAAELKECNAQLVQWGSSDYSDELYVTGEVKFPLSESDREAIVQWLADNPELPPQPIKWRTPLDFGQAL